MVMGPKPPRNRHKMSDQPTPEKQPPEDPNWRTPATLFGVLFLCIGVLWLTQLHGCGNGTKNHPAVRSTYYYQLVFHTKQMGPAVYQATGDQGNQNSKPLFLWLLKAESLTHSMGKDKASSDDCKQAGKQTEVELHKLNSQTEGDKAYGTGYKAWKAVNDLLLKCQ